MGINRGPPARYRGAPYAQLLPYMRLLLRVASATLKASIFKRV